MKVPQKQAETLGIVEGVPTAKPSRDEDKIDLDEGDDE